MEFFNETIFLVLTYHMMFYVSPWALKERDSYGWSLIVFVVVMIVTNYFIIFSVSMRDSRFKFKLWVFKRLKNKILKERYEEISKI